jgi:2-isopropylmalate synthase
MQDHVLVYDTTLRDGMQGEGVSLSVDEKITVAHALDRLGFHLIEAGFPGSNPKERALFDRLSVEQFDTASICAFGMTRRRDLEACDDPALCALAESFAPVCTLVGKTWGLHLEKVTKATGAQNLAMIFDSVQFLRSRQKRVIYDAEHFFDGYADDAAYALECLEAAVSAGAECVTLCDTNGSTLPARLSEVTQAVVEALGSRCTVGIHTHNDTGCAVANSILAVQAGARLVQGTMNGYGERCGNADIASVVAGLQLKVGFDCIPPQRMDRLTESAHLVDEVLNRSPSPTQPYVGKSAFAHKGGMHVAGIVEDTRTFEHLDPGLVGNRRELVISELSGKGTVLERARTAGVSLDDATAQTICEEVKQLEHKGFAFEAADGSFDLLIQRAAGEYDYLFTLESFRVIVEKYAADRVQTEATIKIWVDGDRYVRTAEGNGPVNALDKALRAAISEKYPHLRDIELVNFKVRILDESKGTGAVTRVLLDSSDGTDTWGSIGVSENVIEASWDALVDSLEAGMLPGRSHNTRHSTERAGSG